MSRAAAFAALLLLALAGCAGSSTSSPSKGLPPPASPGYAFGPASTPSNAPDGFGSEPSLLVAPDGAVYFSSILGSATARGDGVWRSADKGATWDYLGKADYPFGGGDSDLEALPDGTLLLTGQWRPAAIPALPAVGSPYVTGGESVFRSTDKGATWTPYPVAGTLPAADRNWLASDPREGGAVYLVYNDLATGLMVSKSVTGGSTWLPPVPVQGSGSVAGVAGGPVGIAGDAVVDAQGTLFIPYGPGPGGGTVQLLFRSDDGGQTFTSHTVHTTPADESSGAIFSTLDVDANGELSFAWAETQHGAMRAFVAHSEDHGATWTDPLAVSPPGVSVAFPWVVSGSPDHLAVAYYGTAGNTTPDNAGKDATWVPMVSFIPDIHAGDAFTVPVTATPNHKGPICTGGTGCTSGRTLGDFFEMARGADGRVAVVWADDTGSAQSNHVAFQTEGPSLLAEP